MRMGKIMARLLHYESQTILYSLTMRSHIFLQFGILPLEIIDTYRFIGIKHWIQWCSWCHRNATTEWEFLLPLPFHGPMKHLGWSLNVVGIFIWTWFAPTYHKPC